MTSDLERLATSYGRDLRADRRSLTTISTYLRAIRSYVSWLASEGLSTDLDGLTRRNVRDYLASLVEADYEAATVCTRFGGLRQFSAWLAAEGEISADPMKDMKYPRVKIKPVPVVTDADLRKLIDSCASKSFLDRRDEAIIRILLDTGIRVSELCSLTVSSIDLDSASAIVTGKGSKTRAIFFSLRTVRALDRYLRVRDKHLHAGDPALFVGGKGALKVYGPQEMLRTRCKAVGIQHIHPHMLRHTMADAWLKAGGTETDLLRLMGWTSVSMLQRYGISQADARAAAAARRLAVGDRV